MPKFERHLFVCTFQRDTSDSRGSCAAKGSVEICDFLKKEVKKRGLQGNVRVNASGCLDHCAEGPAVVVYPESVWYKVPTLKEAEEIAEKHLQNGELVDSLTLYKN